MATAITNGATEQDAPQDHPITNGVATEQDAALLQEAQDAYTRVTLAIRRCATEVLKVTAEGSGGRALASGCISHLKEIVPMTEQIDAMQIRVATKEATSTEINELLKENGAVYLKLWKLYAEFMAVYKANGGVALIQENKKLKM